MFLSFEDGDDRLCIECSHAVRFHGEQGCMYRSAGLIDRPPMPCVCKITRFKLRTDHELTSDLAERGVQICASRNDVEHCEYQHTQGDYKNRKCN